MLQNFPEGFKPYDYQVEIFKQIEKCFNNNKKFLIIQAPTGTGKSFICKTIANISREAPDDIKRYVDSGEIYRLGMPGSKISYEDIYETDPYGCYVLTITKQLQDQYKSLFEDTQNLKGKSNYECFIDKEFEVDTAPCNYLDKQRQECKSKKCCYYYNALDDTIKSQFGCLSYSKFLTLDDALKRRQYIVCDEASELEDALVNEFSFTLNHYDTQKAGAKYKNSTDKNKVFASLQECYEAIEVHIDNIKKELSKSKKSKAKLITDFRKFSNMYNGLKTLIATFYSCDYIIKHDFKETTFVPLKVDMLSGNVFDHGEKVILMSATIVGIDSFVRALGISRDDYDYIECDSVFDSKKSPIYVFPDTKLNNGNLELTIKNTIIKRIEGILDHHKNDKGIIHTHTHKITNLILDNIDPKYKNRLLCRIQGEKDNNDILEEHSNTTDPTVLVSSSMTFGVDLKDDLGRFQIIIKLPYLPLMDERVRRLKEESSKWYVMKMFSILIQACGRTTRNAKDHSVTYIMDSNFLNMFKIHKKELPKHFIKRCTNK